VKILVIDDHPLVVDALKALLPQWGDGVEVLAAGDAAAAIRLLDDEPAIALTLLDLALPGTRGLDFLADLMLDYPGVPVLVLSATHDRATVAAVLRRGRARLRIEDGAGPRPCSRRSPRSPTATSTSPMNSPTSPMRTVSGSRPTSSA